jgi:ABC-2 type transport system permease protein
MLTNVYTKTILERWKGMIIGAFGMAVMLWFGMMVYQDLDMSVFREMPEVWRAIMNIGEDADATGLAYGAIYSSYGALTMAAIALSIGSGSIAGEERNGTFGLLLGNPRSRTQVLLAKAGSMLTLTALGTLLLWGAGIIVPELISADVSDMHVTALIIHMFMISIFFGFMAMAIGAWTGNRSLASGVTAGYMVLSFIAAGLLPLISGWERVSDAFIWHYYDSASPITTGADWGHLGVLLTATLAMAAIAVVGLRRRDLKERGVAVTTLDRLRANPRTQKVMEKIAGSARVSRIAAKTVSDHQTLTFAIGYVVVLMGVFMGPFYLAIDHVIADFADQFPEAILAMVGFADMATAEGWYQTENFSMTIPIALIVLTAAVGSKALAGEEGRRTMGLLLGNPVTRRSVVVEKAIALIGMASIIGVLTFLGTMAGSLMANLGMSYVNVAATSLLATLLGIMFGALALALSAATGKVKIATYGTSAAALVFYILNAFLPLSDSLAGLARWSPFYYYLTSDPLNNGMHWGHAGILAGLTAILLVAAVVLFERRDLRQTS